MSLHCYFLTHRAGGLVIPSSTASDIPAVQTVASFVKGSFAQSFTVAFAFRLVSLKAFQVNEKEF